MKQHQISIHAILYGQLVILNMSESEQTNIVYCYAEKYLFHICYMNVRPARHSRYDKKKLIVSF